jgi:hypothetical protein
MPDEQNYTSYLLSIDDVIQKLGGVERRVVEYAWELYRSTLELEAYLKERSEQQLNGDGNTSTSSAPNVSSF